MKHPALLRTLAFLCLLMAFSFGNLYAEKTDKYIKHGTELLDMLNTDFYKSDVQLYTESIDPITRKKGDNAFIWPQAHMYHALYWGTKLDSKYKTRLKSAIEKVDWYMNGEAYGCIRGGQRFFDDNGIIGLAIMNAWQEFFPDNQAIRNRALIALEYCLKYKDEFWGLPQTEPDLGKGIFYVGPVNPLASAYALSYKVTNDEDELALAKKYFDVLNDPDYKLKYDNSEIFRSGSRHVDGVWNGNTSGARASPTCGVAVLAVRLYAVTQDTYYLERARAMTTAILNRWQKSNGGFSEISMWGGSGIVSLLCELYDVDNDVKWYYAAQRIVDFLIDKARDKNGFYPTGNTAADGAWGNVRTDSDSPEKITMMSQACAAHAILRFAYLYQNTDIPDLDPDADPVYNGKRIYLSPEGSGDLSGSSWENAAAFNGDVIPADIGAAEGDTLWLKAGTYNRTKTVDFAKIAIYGGFNGTETKLNARNYALNPTIIDGGGRNMRLFTNTNDRTGMRATIDGLILQNASFGAGNAAANNGAALNLNSGAVIRNCILRNNSTPAKGAGVMINQSSNKDLETQVILENCLFINNTSLDANDASAGGSAMQIGSNQAVTIINCTFANNKNASSNYGAAIGIAKSSKSIIKMYNCLVYDNVNASNTKVSVHMVGSDEITEIDASSSFMNNAIEQPEAIFTAEDGNITLNESVNPLFVRPTTYYGKQTEEAAIDAINNSSYCIEDESPCVDTGKNSFITPKNDFDLAGNLRVRNGVIDIGAYESMYEEEETAISQVKSTDLKYYITGNEVHLLNTKSGESLRVYNTLGTIVKTVPTAEKETIISPQADFTL